MNMSILHEGLRAPSNFMTLPKAPKRCVNSSVRAFFHSCLRRWTWVFSFIQHLIIKGCQKQNLPSESTSLVLNKLKHICGAVLDPNFTHSNLRLYSFWKDLVNEDQSLPHCSFTSPIASLQGCIAGQRSRKRVRTPALGFPKDLVAGKEKTRRIIGTVGVFFDGKQHLILWQDGWFAVFFSRSGWFSGVIVILYLYKYIFIHLHVKNAITSIFLLFEKLWMIHVAESFQGMQ